MAFLRSGDHDYDGGDGDGDGNKHHVVVMLPWAIGHFDPFFLNPFLPSHLKIKTFGCSPLPPYIFKTFVMAG